MKFQSVFHSNLISSSFEQSKDNEEVFHSFYYFNNHEYLFFIIKSTQTKKDFPFHQKFVLEKWKLVEEKIDFLSIFHIQVESLPHHPSNKKWILQKSVQLDRPYLVTDFHVCFSMLVLSYFDGSVELRE